MSSNYGSVWFPDYPMRLALIIVTLAVTFTVHILFARLSRTLVQQTYEHVTSMATQYDTSNTTKLVPAFLSLDMMAFKRDASSCCASHVSSDDLMAEHFGVITDCVVVQSRSMQVVPLYQFMDPMPSLLAPLPSIEENTNLPDSNTNWEEKFDHFISLVKENYTAGGKPFSDLLPDLKWGSIDECYR